MPDAHLQSNREALLTWIEQKLTERLQPTELDIEDQSYLHAGHAGAGKGGHFAITIKSAAFADLSRLQRHQLVYDTLAEEIGHAIHALSLQLGT